MLVIGITGGVASGKSTVSNILSKMGVIILNADIIGHKTYETGTVCYDKLVEKFGPSILNENGDINRRKLGEIVFSDKSKMAELTGIVWPEIRTMLVKELDAIRSGANSNDPAPIVALEAAVMIEASWNDLVSTLWVVQVDQVVAKRFLMARNNLSAEEAEKRIDSQISNEERCKYASFIINNNGSLDQLEVETRRIFELSINS